MYEGDLKHEIFVSGGGGTVGLQKLQKIKNLGLEFRS